MIRKKAGFIKNKILNAVPLTIDDIIVVICYQISGIAIYLNKQCGERICPLFFYIILIIH